MQSCLVYWQLTSSYPRTGASSLILYRRGGGWWIHPIPPISSQSIPPKFAKNVLGTMAPYSLTACRTLTAQMTNPPVTLHPSTPSGRCTFTCFCIISSFSSVTDFSAKIFGLQRTWIEILNSHAKCICTLVMIILPFVMIPHSTEVQILVGRLWKGPSASWMVTCMYAYSNLEREYIKAE